MKRGEDILNWKWNMKKSISLSHSLSPFKRDAEIIHKECNIEYYRTRGLFLSFVNDFSFETVNVELWNFKFFDRDTIYQQKCYHRHNFHTLPRQPFNKNNNSVQQTNKGERKKTLNSPKLQYFNRFESFFLPKKKKWRKLFFNVNCEIFQCTNHKS